MMDWNGDGASVGGWIAMAMMMVVFWSVIVVGTVAVVRNWHHQSEPANQASRILDERFAKGEIEQDEYQKRRDVLTTKSK